MQAKGLSIVEIMVALSVIMFISVAAQRFVTGQNRSRAGVVSTRRLHALEEQLRRASAQWSEVYRSATVLDPEDSRKFFYDELGSCLAGGTKACPDQVANQNSGAYGFFLFMPQRTSREMDPSLVEEPTFLAGTRDRPLFYSLDGEPYYRKGYEDEIPCFQLDKAVPECPVQVFSEAKVRCSAGQKECHRVEGLDLFVQMSAALDDSGEPMIHERMGIPVPTRTIKISHRNGEVRSGLKVRVLRIQGRLQNCVYMTMTGKGSGYPQTHQLGCGMRSAIQPPPTVVKKYLEGKWQKRWPFVGEFPQEFEFAVPLGCRVKFGFVTWVPSLTKFSVETANGVIDKEVPALCPNTVPPRPNYETNEPFGERPCGYYVTETESSRGPRRSGSQVREQRWEKRGELRRFPTKNDFQYYEVLSNPPDPNIIVTFRDGGGWESDDRQKARGDVVISVEVEPSLCEVDL
jgi:hypothetical protein